MNGYTYGYIKSAILAMMDLTEEEMNQNNLMNKIPYLLNQGMTALCSSVKPHHVYVSFYVNQNMVNKPINIASLVDIDYIGFSGRKNYVSSLISLSFLNDAINGDADSVDKIIVEDEKTELARNEYMKHYKMNMCECHDENMIQMGYDHVICKNKGFYQIGVKCRWWKFMISTDDKTQINCPEDILDALILYVASELWSLEDERKGAQLRNKYELAVSRIDDTNYNNTTTFKVEGDW